MENSQVEFLLVNLLAKVEALEKTICDEPELKAKYEAHLKPLFESAESSWKEERLKALEGDSAPPLNL